MLINKAVENGSKIAVKIRYNGKEIIVAPGGRLDVRDFEVANKDVGGTEKHIMAKNPGVFEWTNEKNDGVVSEEMLKENKDLKSLFDTKTNECASLKKVNEELNKIHASSVEEAEAYRKEAASNKKEAARLKKEVSSLEDEIQKLRLQLGTGKK